MINAERLLGKLLRKRLPAPLQNRLGRSLGISGSSGVMLLGGLAAAAFEHFAGQRNPTQSSPSPGSRVPAPPPVTGSSMPPPPGGALGGRQPSPPPPPMSGDNSPLAPQASPGEAHTIATTLIRAMIAAAKADGRIDAEERRRIVDKMAEADHEERAFLEAELDRPLDLEDILARVDRPEVAVEVYIASLLAIDADTDAERRYLAALARRLQLDPGTVTRLHQQLDRPPPA